MVGTALILAQKAALVKIIGNFCNICKRFIYL